MCIHAAAQLDFAKCALRTGEAGEEICKIRDKIDEIRQRIHVCIWAPHLPVVKSQLLQNKTTIGLNLDMACKVPLYTFSSSPGPTSHKGLSPEPEHESLFTSTRACAMFCTA